MSGIAQPPKMPKLIVVVAFDRGEDGDLVEAFGRRNSRAKSAPCGPQKDLT